MLKQINKGFAKGSSDSKLCWTCDTKDYCVKCDALDWGCSGGWETCITKDSDG
ncbi:hypothetical protein SAMN05518670_0160 [Paenibacillus sp. OK076]|nr:hypothetical protein SAMN05518670_0160 [Paenibacillus sp. OK076]